MIVCLDVGVLFVLVWLILIMMAMDGDYIVHIKKENGHHHHQQQQGFNTTNDAFSHFGILEDNKNPTLSLSLLYTHTHTHKIYIISQCQDFHIRIALVDVRMGFAMCTAAYLCGSSLILRPRTTHSFIIILATAFFLFSFFPPPTPSKSQNAGGVAKQANKAWWHSLKRGGKQRERKRTSSSDYLCMRYVIYNTSYNLALIHGMIFVSISSAWPGLAWPGLVCHCHSRHLWVDSRRAGCVLSGLRLRVTTRAEKWVRNASILGALAAVTYCKQYLY